MLARYNLTYSSILPELRFHCMCSWGKNWLRLSKPVNYYSAMHAMLIFIPAGGADTNSTGKEDFQAKALLMTTINALLKFSIPCLSLTFVFTPPASSSSVQFNCTGFCFSLLQQNWRRICSQQMHRTSFKPIVIQILPIVEVSPDSHIVFVQQRITFPPKFWQYTAWYISSVTYFLLMQIYVP